MPKKAATSKSSVDTIGELRTQLAERQEAYFRLRFRHSTTPLKNPMEIRQIRREIARLKTALSSKNDGKAA